MNSKRTAITLGYDAREEIEKGVWENNLTEKKVKAYQENIFQSRLDKAFQEGFVIKARFRIRAFLVTGELKYVEWKGLQYKVNTVNEDLESHDVIIEIGELI